MKTVWIVLCLLSVAGLCHADRDIVYAARYYAPPGSRRTSHFHIYRINPDGTGRTQLTFGSDDEYTPKWSSDGRLITFFVNDGVSWGKICEIGASGGRPRIVKRLTEAPSIPNPPVAFGYRLEDVDMENGVSERHILFNLKTGRRLTLLTDDDTLPTLLPAPGHGLIYADNRHTSTVGTNFAFYRLNPATGALHYLTEGQFLAWSPDGARFCTAPGRDTTPFEKRREPLAVETGASQEQRDEARYRTVWAAPLYVRAAGGGKMRQITPRLSWVTGADWRRGK